MGGSAGEPASSSTTEPSRLAAPRQLQPHPTQRPPPQLHTQRSGRHFCKKVEFIAFSNKIYTTVSPLQLSDVRRDVPSPGKPASPGGRRQERSPPIAAVPSLGPPSSPSYSRLSFQSPLTSPSCTEKGTAGPEHPQHRGCRSCLHIDTATEDSELVKQAFFFFFLLLLFFLVIPTPTCVQPQLPVLLESQVSAASLPKTPQKNNNKRKTKQRSKGTGLGARSFQRRGPTLGPRGTQISARSAAASTSPAVEHPQAGGGRWLCPGGTAQRRAPAVLRARRKNGFVVFRFFVGGCLVFFCRRWK